jgi:hypothetical protein
MENNVNTALSEHLSEEKEVTIDFVPDKKHIDENTVLILHAIPAVVSFIFDVFFLEDKT